MGSDVPKYARIKADIIEKLGASIAADKIRPGDKILSETDIIMDYGVSPNTAKRVLNDLVHEGKIYRVRGRGSFLADWQANGNDATDRPKTIGLIVPGVTFSFFAEIAYGCERVARERGYTVTLCNSMDVEKEAEYLQRCCEAPVDGIIICVAGVVTEGGVGHPAATFKISNRELLTQVSSRIPTVVLDQFIDGIDASFVFNDDAAGAVEAVQHLLDIGRRKVVHLAGPLGHAGSDARLEGYRRALRGAGLEMDESMVKRGDYFERFGYEHLNALLAEKKDFDAVFACDDKVATGAYTALLEHGFRVPEDVAIVGFANETEPLIRGLRFTTVDQQAERAGAEAMELLDYRINRRSRVPHSVVKMIPTRLVIRESTIGAPSGVRTAAAVQEPLAVG